MKEIKIRQSICLKVFKNKDRNNFYSSNAMMKFDSSLLVHKIIIKSMVNLFTSTMYQVNGIL